MNKITTEQKFNLKTKLNLASWLSLSGRQKAIKIFYFSYSQLFNIIYVIFIISCVRVCVNARYV